MVIKEPRFYDLTVSRRILYVCFLLMLGVAYMMALTELYVTHKGLSGKPGISIDDIKASYYGNRSGTRLETALRGTMAANIALDDRDIMLAWLKDGAPKSDYDTKIVPILKKTCLNCHSPASGMGLPDYTTYEGLDKMIQIDTGMSIGTLIKVAHIHLFGITLFVFVLGSIFVHAELNVWFKRALIATPMAAVFVDVAAWFLTKWDPTFAWVVVIAGSFLGISLTLQILISLYQILFLRRPVSE